MNNILLSICIPTFNRAVVLKKSIESIVSQKEFDQKVELVISDNCSDDDTSKVVELFQKKYPNVRYNRNDENIGAEKNIFKVLKLGNGKFLKLANDYSIFKDGSLKLILDIIKQHESDHSVICFSNKRINLTEEIINCENFNEFISKVSYVTTWILCFGIWKTEFDLIITGTFKKYDFPHLDLLLRNLKLGFKPVVFNKLFISNQTLPIQGGYDIFKTFIQNYLDLLSQYVGENQILKSTFIKEKRKLLYDFIYPWYCLVVIEKNKSYNFYYAGIKSYLVKYFGIKDMFIFTSLTLKYRIKRLVIMFFKKLVLNRVATVLYKIMHSTTYCELENAIDIGSFKAFGENSELPPQKIIRNPNFISIGNNFHALKNLRIEVSDECNGEYSPEVIIGNGVKMNTDVHIECIKKILIGDNVMFSSRVYISDYSLDVRADGSSSLRPMKSEGPVIIKDNVSIGEGAAILSGVTIGENSIILANSLVLTSFPANCVIAGNPAGIFKMLT